MLRWRLRAQAAHRGPGSIVHPHYLLMAILAIGLTSVYLPVMRTAFASNRPTAVLGATIQAAQNTACASSTHPTEIDLFRSNKQLQLAVDDPTYYPVKGTTVTDIATAIQHCAQADPAGEGYSAQTNYTLTWFYDTHRTGDLCTLRNVRVGMHIAVTLPQWQPSANPSAQLQSSWDSYLNALTQHENGHAALDAQYAGLLVQRLHSLPAMPCNDVSSQVRTVTSATEAQLATANTAYDEATNHGATQGAVFTGR